MAELHGKVDSIGSEVGSITAALRGLLEEGRVSKDRKIKTLGTQVVQSFLGDLLGRLDRVNSDLADIGKVTSHISPPPPVHGPDTPLSYNSPVSQPALPPDGPPPHEKALDQPNHQNQQIEQQSLEQQPNHPPHHQPEQQPDPQPEPHPEESHQQTEEEPKVQDSQQHQANDVSPPEDDATQTETCHHVEPQFVSTQTPAVEAEPLQSELPTVNTVVSESGIAFEDQTALEPVDTARASSIPPSPSLPVDQQSAHSDPSSHVPTTLSNGSVYLDPVIQDRASPMFSCAYKDVNKLNEELFERYSSHPVVRDRGYFKLQVRDLPPLAVHEVSRPGKFHATSFTYQIDQHGLVKVDTGKKIRFKAPHLPFPTSKKKHWTFEEQKELWNSSAARPPRGSRPYIIGNPLFEDIDLHPGEKLKRRGRTVLEGINTQYVYFNLTGKTITTMHREDAHVRSENLLRSGEHKFWCFIKPAFAAKFEERMQLEYREMRRCSQAVRHLSRHIPPSVLEAWGIEYTLDYCYPGQAVVTEPGTYHQVLNLGPNYALAVNMEYESSPDHPPNYKFCDNHCPDKFAMKAADFRLYEELYNDKWGERSENGGPGVRSSMAIQSSMAPAAQSSMLATKRSSMAPTSRSSMAPAPPAAPTPGPVQSVTPPPEQSVSSLSAPALSESAPSPQSSSNGRELETPSPAVDKPHGEQHQQRLQQQQKQDDGSRPVAAEETPVRPPMATPAPTVAPETRTAPSLPAFLQRPLLYAPIPERPEPLRSSSLSSIRGLAPPPNFLGTPISCLRSPARGEQDPSTLPPFHNHHFPSGLSAPLPAPDPPSRPDPPSQIEPPSQLEPPSRPAPTPFRKTARMLGNKRPAEASPPPSLLKKPRLSKTQSSMEPRFAPKPQVTEALPTQHPMPEPHFVLASPLFISSPDQVCGKPAFDRLARLFEGWRGYCKSSHVELGGINLVNLVEQMPGDNPELYTFLVRFCKMRLAEKFDGMPKGRRNSARKPEDAMNALLAELDWDESQRHRLHDYLREGKCWLTLTDRFEGLLPILPSGSDAEALELALFEDQVKSFQKQLKTVFAKKLCAVGKTLQDSIWNCRELPEYVFESAYRPWFTVQQIMPLLKKFTLLKETFYDAKLPYHWGLRPSKKWSLFWGWPSNPVAVPAHVRWCDAPGCRRRMNCRCVSRLIPDVPRISINGPRGPGIRAVGSFKPGEILGELTGEIVPAGMFAGSGEWTWEIRRPDVDGDVVGEIWPRERGNWVRLVPHSLTPTAEYQLKKMTGMWRTVLVALDTIKDGDEITVKCGWGYDREQLYALVEGLQ
ncbi:hypothetical protein QBC44DRAFT_339130 [Cladorrhinum sp. PSN332]|nr:hypothetical protein QBC44DRAFT_339130 [Cladorrhinum sp. PSN332]